MTRTSRIGPRHLVAILGLTAAALPPVLLAEAPAAHAAVCSPGSGVSVIVDFGQLGSVKSGCAAGSPATGLKALSGAGFGYSYVPGQTGMICRIDSLPDPCPGTPPVDKYWSYWIADRGGSWTYSSKGAGNRTPPPGSVDGWAFGAGNPPAQAPPAKGSSGGGGDNGGGDSGSGTGGGTGDGGGSGKSGKSKSAEPGATSKAKGDKSSDDKDSTSGPGSDPGTGESSAAAASNADYDNAADIGSGMGTVGGVFGAGIVAVLVSGLGWKLWQRRRANAEPEPAE